jgi:DNA-binding IclR family transcriptional regulator
MQVVTRALAVLRTLADHPEGDTLQELCRALSVPPPTMHRLLAVLSAEGFVVRSTTTRRYTLGPDAFVLSAGARHIADVARDALAEVNRLTQETAFATELVGDRAVCVALVESSRPLRLFVRVGQELPLHAAASSRTILAYLDERRVKEMVEAAGFERFTEETPGSIEEVLGRLQMIRHRGYDLCDDELDPNVWAVGAPIQDSSGEVVASVTVAGPLERMNAVRKKQVIAEVVNAAASISQRLGFNQTRALHR